MKENRPQAIIFGKRSLEIDSTNPMPYFNIGLASNQPGNLEQSAECFDNYIEYAPNPTPAILERLRPIGYQI